MKIELVNINKTYLETIAVNEVSLTINDGELMVLLGPSGCGKSTLLRIIAGLIDATSGRLFFDGVNVTEQPAQQRKTAMVFQNYALFPHLNVFDNIGFGLKVRGAGKAAMAERVAEMTKIVELQGLEKRKIQELSGGQRQRVALARALITRPDILLFDEPLSNLDEKLRVTMRQNIRQLQKQFGITTIYVTHDQEEAMSIADRITVMQAGDILQTDTPEQVYGNPRNRFVAEFVGQANFFEIRDEQAKILQVKVPFPGVDSSHYVMLRPERVVFSETGVSGVITFKENLGLLTRYVVLVQGREIKVDALSSLLQKNYEVGSPVHLRWDISSLVLTQKYVPRI